MFDPAFWDTPTCSGAVQLPPISNQPFEEPERPQGPYPSLTRAQADALFNYGNGSILLVDRELNPGDSFVHDLFSPTAQDVTLYFYGFTDRSEERRLGQKVVFTVLVDYVPVVAMWTRWDDSHVEPMLQTQGSHMAFENPRRIELVEVTIPASQFPQARIYEISFAQMEAPHSNSSRSSRRLVLYNGGYALPSQPCALPPLGDEITEFEKVLFPAGIAATIFGEATEHEGHLRGEPMVAKPGAKLTLHGTFWRTALSPKITVVQPIVNGAPVGQPLWITQGGDNPHRYQLIDARFTFEVTLPAEPGVHAVSLATWEDPYRPCRDLEGNDIRGCSKSGSVSRHSNVLRFDTTSH